MIPMIQIYLVSSTFWSIFYIQSYNKLIYALSYLFLFPNIKWNLYFPKVLGLCIFRMCTHSSTSLLEDSKQVEFVFLYPRITLITLLLLLSSHLSPPLSSHASYQLKQSYKVHRLVQKRMGREVFSEVDIQSHFRSKEIHCKHR